MSGACDCAGSRSMEAAVGRRTRVAASASLRPPASSAYGFPPRPLLPPRSRTSATIIDGYLELTSAAASALSLRETACAAGWPDAGRYAHSSVDRRAAAQDA